jgi:hypothetical protein
MVSILFAAAFVYLQEFNSCWIRSKSFRGSDSNDFENSAVGLKCRLEDKFNVRPIAASQDLGVYVLACEFANIPILPFSKDY